MILCLLLSGCGTTFSKSELKQLKENAATHSGEVHKRITFGEEAFQNAVLLETIFCYTDVYDNTKGPDYAHVYSKYQMEDGAVIYFDTYISDMKGIGELCDKPIFLTPFEEQESDYTKYENLAKTGKSESNELTLKKVGENVYAHERASESVCNYYFVVE